MHHVRHRVRHLTRHRALAHPEHQRPARSAPIMRRRPMRRRRHAAAARCHDRPAPDRRRARHHSRPRLLIDTPSARRDIIEPLRAIRRRRHSAIPGAVRIGTSRHRHQHTQHRQHRQHRQPNPHTGTKPVHERETLQHMRVGIDTSQRHRSTATHLGPTNEHFGGAVRPTPLTPSNRPSPQTVVPPASANRIGTRRQRLPNRSFSRSAST